MKDIQKRLVNIESAGRVVKIAPTESVLDVRADGNIAHFVLSPVLFRGKWTMPLEVTVRDCDGKRRLVLKQAQPTEQQRATVLLNEQRYFVAEVAAADLAVDELAIDGTIVRSSSN